MSNVVSTAQRLQKLSIGTIGEYMQRHAEQTSEVRKMPINYVQMASHGSDLYYLIGSQVFVVRPTDDQAFSRFLGYDQVMTHCQVALLGFDPDFVPSDDPADLATPLCEHPIGRSLGDLSPTSHAAIETMGCSVHKGMKGLVRHCDFTIGMVGTHLPILGQPYNG